MNNYKKAQTRSHVIIYDIFFNNNSPCVLCIQFLFSSMHYDFYFYLVTIRILRTILDNISLNNNNFCNGNDL